MQVLYKMSVVSAKHEKFTDKDGKEVLFTEVRVRDDGAQNVFRLSKIGHPALPEIDTPIDVVFHIKAGKKDRPEIGVIEF